MTDLATHLPRESYEVAVIGSAEAENGSFWEILRSYGVTTLALKSLRFHPNLHNDFISARAIKKFLDEWQPDIVHLTDFKSSVLGSLAIHGNDLRFVVYTPHGWIFNEEFSALKKRWYIFLEKFTAHRKNVIICSSQKEKDQTLTLKIKDAPHLPIIYNGIPYAPIPDPDVISHAKFELFSLLQKKYNLPLDFQLNPIVGVMSNFYPPKGLSYFIEAARLVHARYPSVNFVIIGDGPQRAILEKQIQSAGLEQSVLLTGFINRAERLISAFDYFVLPSLEEGLPYALLEAMARKKPIVATTVGAIPEVLRDKESAVLIPPANAQALANGMRALLEDPKLAQTLLNGALDALTDELTLQTMMEKTMKIYESATK